VIERVENLGLLVGECGISGETVADGRCPGMGSIIPLSANRWLLVYSTRDYRFRYATRSLIYQLRADTPVGPVIREGRLVGSDDAPGSSDDQTKLRTEHGCATMFGVPKGALIAGKPAPNANLFALKWYTVGTELVELPSPSEDAAAHFRRVSKMGHTQWLQFRLNDRGDDIEIIQPARLLRQTGCETGSNIGFTPDGEPLHRMISSNVDPVLANGDCTQWGEVNRFDQGLRAAVAYQFNPTRGAYEWTRTGPVIQLDNPRVSAGWTSLVRTPTDWVVAIQKAPFTWPIPPQNTDSDSDGLDPDEKGVVWIRTQDLWRSSPAAVYPTEPAMYASPVTAYRCADGIVRLFGGDQTLCAPPRGCRHPLRCWDINPDNGFSATNHRVIFDAFKAGLHLQPRSATEPEKTPAASKARVITHAGGNEQYILYLVTLRPEEMAEAGLYCDKLIYDREYPGRWTFQ